MKREELFVAPQPPAAQVELMLARIEQSRAFQASPRHRALLRHLVDRTLADEVAGLKETVIAVEVFGRSAGGFDPRFDSIVRVEARRLRKRLATYFGTEGRDSPWRIELPVGSYVPLIAARDPRPPIAPTRAGAQATWWSVVNITCAWRCPRPRWSRRWSALTPHCVNRPAWSQPMSAWAARG